jgi:hypothetical protein
MTKGLGYKKGFLRLLGFKVRFIFGWGAHTGN